LSTKIEQESKKSFYHPAIAIRLFLVILWEETRVLGSYY